MKCIASCFPQFTVILSFVGLCSCSIPSIEESCIFEAPGISEEIITGQSLSSNNVVFTFSGPLNDTAVSIADVLSTNGIEGTYFVSGKSIVSNFEKLNTIYQQGHQIGNGGYSGKSLVSSKQPSMELRRTDYLITPYIINNQYLFRAPGGEFDSRVAKRLNQDGLVKYTGPVGFDHIGTTDQQCWADDTDFSQCATNIFSDIQSTGNGIIAIDTSDPRAVNLTGSLINTVNAAGFSFVTMEDIPAISNSLVANGSTIGTETVSSCDDYE